ncbi:alpha/beta hydrolase [Kaistia algarum]|uniref:alpha/beta fold hydrolase n=1 Tax=Kaistia algarum TaxID=2083279 RepID=UPI000CE7303E|nr:alpha/beta hydrolase [Kaistia algarum]MCX5512595.1 alpha/beta hydrolase [Kaistia algarum]PPE81883.1 alpha/beta hydrolase [Kaistia algarum]
MDTTSLLRDDALLRVFDSGSGYPVVFQHGLGGDEAQARGNFPDGPEFRRITVECRGQGASCAGSIRPFSIAMFADDVLAAVDARGISHFVVGGISMGAAIALRVAIRHPERVAALILARPAWVQQPAPENMQAYAEVASWLRRLPPKGARAAFAASPIGERLKREAPDNLASLLGFFDRPDAKLTADLLADIAADGPGISDADIAAIAVPTLVIGHGIDIAHPLAYAQDLASRIAGATLVEITPKATDKARHTAEFRSAVQSFLTLVIPAMEPLS